MKTQSATTLIQETRIRRLNDRGPTKGEYVLYWMQQTLRAELNHALEYAVQRANDLNQPLLRKADMAAYIDRVDELVRKAQEP